MGCARALLPGGRVMTPTTGSVKRAWALKVHGPQSVKSRSAASTANPVAELGTCTMTAPGRRCHDCSASATITPRLQVVGLRHYLHFK